MSRGTRAQRDAGYQRRMREDGERDALAGRPQAAGEPGYVEAYERARRAAPTIPNGYSRTDPLQRLGILVRQTFGDAEGHTIIELSLDRVVAKFGPEGGPEQAYIAALREVAVERHPKWATENGLA